MGPGGSPPLVLLDRAAELAAIAAAIDSACSGSGSALLVEGVAGIGKTRLLAHACEQAARAGMRVLTARAAEFEDGYAWGVVRQLFEADIRVGGGRRRADDAVALARSTGWPRRGEIALALSQALGLCGRFADAVEVLQAAISESGDDRSPVAVSLQAALLNAARWDLDTRPIVWPILEQLQARAEGGEELDPQVHANLAIELGAAGLDRERAIRHAREAVRATPRLMSLTSTALPEAVTVLLFAGMSSEARHGAHTWLRLAQQRHLPFTRWSVMPRYHHRCSDDLSQLTRFWLIIRVWMVVVAAVPPCTG